MDNQKCNVCNIGLPMREFRCKNGYYSHTCKKCQNRKGKLYYYKRREKLIEEINKHKLMVGCEICGWNKYSSALDFHHIDPSIKIDTVANLLNRGQHGISKILKEVDKCIILCSNCHRGLHSGDIILPPEIASRDSP